MWSQKVLGHLGYNKHCFTHLFAKIFITLETMVTLYLRGQECLVIQLLLKYKP